LQALPRKRKKVDKRGRVKENGMEITVNGQKRLYDGPGTVQGLLAFLGIHPGTVVVEVNRRIVPQNQRENEMIGEGDTIEIVRLVRGG